jgi:hypothetical protein
MTESKRARITFAKVVVVMAIVFTVSLGLCGLSVALSSNSAGQGTVYIVMLFAGAAGMLIAGLSLLVTLFAWAIVAIARSSGRKAAEPPRPPGDSNHPGT